MDATCPLCSAVERRDTLASNAHAVAIPDAYPVNPGHALVVSRRHVADLFDLDADEQAGLWALVPSVKQALDERHRPTGYNIGINVGVSAGQTIDHVHIHVVPRYDGDVDDPSGGVRFVIPSRGNYRRPGHIPRVPD
jgi:diadenosine tetraphosphate (Ap4A) HIT family hydrolase